MRRRVSASEKNYGKIAFGKLLVVGKRAEMTGGKKHWEDIYAARKPDEVSWYREHLDKSLELIRRTGAAKDRAVIDIGGGNSTLVDDLLAEGFSNVSVLDISRNAIEASKKRLGGKSSEVEWIEADIAAAAAALPDNFYDVWHDRAVFHFLTDRQDREKYLDLVRRCVKNGGHVIVAAFGLDGPAKCSGLDIVRYDPETMHAEFGNDFELVDSFDETHRTPFGTTQEFIYCYCRKLV